MCRLVNPNTFCQTKSSMQVQHMTTHMIAQNDSRRASIAMAMLSESEETKAALLRQFVQLETLADPS